MNKFKLLSINKFLVLGFLFATFTFKLSAQAIIELYKETIPNTQPCSVIEQALTEGRVLGVTKPVLYVYKPVVQDSLKTAIIICPGGGYARLAINHEGFSVAETLANKGITAFVLKYRNPIDSSCFINKEILALQDAQRAIQLIRENAEAWNINKDLIGIIGFSAGGHLASTIITHFNNSYIDNQKNIDLRPNFAALIYPVISFADSITHKGSKNNMLGLQPTIQKVTAYSNELQVTKETPPCFIIHAADDKSVPVENSLLFYSALLKKKVKAELHVFEKGGHGFGMWNKAMNSTTWMPLLINWLRANQFIKGNVKQ
jgi:acetyl esterase/lipase